MWTLELLPYLEPLLSRPQQPDNLCGPYWIALLLQMLGGLSTSAVDVAIAAHTLLPDQAGTWTPLGANALQGEGYSTIPTCPVVDQCGTSLMGLMEATELLSRGQFCLVPLQAVQWETGLASLWELCQTHPKWQVVPLLNSHTHYFWGSQLSPAMLSSYLQGQAIEAPLADWSVGHFALLGGSVNGQVKRLYVILDTYRQLGWDGLHLQPSSTLAASLSRPQHSTAGGIALFLASSVRSKVEQIIGDIGFQVTTWDNGTPMPRPISISPS
ncbi:MAG: hypothetical protein AAFU71_18230 [Cyanobacteria bacterium J06632_22]